MKKTTKAMTTKTMTMLVVMFASGCAIAYRGTAIVDTKATVNRTGISGDSFT